MRALATLALLLLSLAAAAAEEKEPYVQHEDYSVFRMALACNQLEHMLAIAERGKPAGTFVAARRPTKEIATPKTRGKKLHCELVWLNTIKLGTKFSLIRAYDLLEF